MTYIDDLIGEVLKCLIENGFGDNTIVTLIGDHGWMLGENQVVFFFNLIILFHLLPLQEQILKHFNYEAL